MNTSGRGGERILGRLRSEGGKGVVRIEERFDTDIGDLWSAITEPVRLARWLGSVDGDLRLGGSYRLFVVADNVETAGQIERCEPPRRLRVTSRETEESFKKGQGAPPFDEVVEVTLTADGEHAVLTAEISGLPLDKIEYYGVGWQIHAENLAKHVEGHERGDTEPRWVELLPAYRELAAEVRQQI
jgi:uncharacterized protein YndB with AHSA1/START domain